MNERISLWDYTHLAELIWREGENHRSRRRRRNLSASLTLNVKFVETPNRADRVSSDALIDSIVPTINVEKSQLTGGGRARTIDHRFLMMV